MSRDISSFFIVQGIIYNEDREVYEYSFEILFSTILSFIVLAVIAVVSNTVMYTTLYMIGFIPLRLIAGGYHAKNHFRCFTLLILTYSLFLVIIKYIAYDYLIETTVLCLLISIIQIFIFSPSEDENKPVTEKETDIFRKRSRYVIIGYTVLVGVMSFFLRDLRFALSITLGNLTVAISLLASHMKVKHKKKDFRNVQRGGHDK